MHTFFTALLLCVGTLGIALVMLPFHITGLGNLKDEDAGGVLEILWGFGFLGVRIAPPGELDVVMLGRLVHHRTIDFSRRDKPAKKKEEKKKSRPDVGVFIEHRKVVIQALRKLAAALRLQARIWGSAGLGRPDHTAYLAMLLEEADAVLPGVGIDVAPNYLEQSLLLEGTVKALLWPAQLLAVTAELLLERDTRELVRALR